MSFPDPVAFPLAQALVGCLETEMARVADPPASVCLRPGQQVDPLLSVTEDECCSGLAWVRIESVYPSSDGIFPAQDDQAGVPCNPRGWAVVLEMGAVRCAPTPDAYSIPDCGEWTAVVDKTMQDAAAMRRAVLCCFDGLDLTYLLGAWSSLPVAGRCAGGTMTVTIEADQLDCCPDDESPAESP